MLTSEIPIACGIQHRVVGNSTGLPTNGSKIEQPEIELWNRVKAKFEVTF